MTVAIARSFSKNSIETFETPIALTLSGCSLKIFSIERQVSSQFHSRSAEPSAFAGAGQCMSPGHHDKQVRHSEGEMVRTEVEVRCLELLERVLEGSLGAALVGVVELRREEDLLAGYARVLDSLADLALVAVRGRSVDVPVARLQGDLDGLLNLARLRLPGAWGKSGPWCLAKRM